MTATVSVNLKLPDVKAITRALQGHRARVGILGAKAERTEAGTPANNAEIGLLQQFGSVKDNIPPRDFLIYPIKSHGKEIINTLSKSQLLKKAIEAQNAETAAKILGIAAEAWVKMAFTNRGFGTWAPNAPATIAKKGSDHPLVDTGQLARSITSDVVSNGASS